MEILQETGDNNWVSAGSCDSITTKAATMIIPIVGFILIVHSLLGIRFFMRSHWGARSVIFCLVFGIVIVSLT